VTRQILPFFLFCALLFAGCAPVTQNQMAAKGSTPLTAKQIFDVVSGNSLYLESVDFNANIYFQPDGSISARAESLTADDVDKGGWDINGANQLCLKFKVWYYGEMKCYSVYPDAIKEFLPTMPKHPVVTLLTCTNPLSQPRKQRICVNHWPVEKPHLLQRTPLNQWQNLPPRPPIFVNP